MKYYSQYRQDEYLHKNFFYDTTGGFFVDVGAHDGCQLNNMLFFEENLGWKGINIEPLPNVFENLQKNRPNCINLNCAISDVDKKNETFIVGLGYTEMLSGLMKSYDPRHLMRMEYENKLHNSDNKLIDVETKRLETVFDEYNVKNVDFLSIDAEGGEFDIIKSINFDKVFIDIIIFEDNYKDVGKKICDYLHEKGFTEFLLDGDIYMIHKNSKYNSKFKDINIFENNKS